jgi:hypothetical protein
MADAAIRDVDLDVMDTRLAPGDSQRLERLVARVGTVSVDLHGLTLKQFVEPFSGPWTSKQ